MKLNLAKELAALERMTVDELHDRCAEVFGETVRSRHREYLIRRIAWRLGTFLDPESTPPFFIPPSTKFGYSSGAKLLPEVIAGVKFINGEKPEKHAA